MKWRGNEYLRKDFSDNSKLSPSARNVSSNFKLLKTYFFDIFTKTTP